MSAPGFAVKAAMFSHLFANCLFIVHQLFVYYLVIALFSYLLIIFCLSYQLRPLCTTCTTNIYIYIYIHINTYVQSHHVRITPLGEAVLRLVSLFVFLRFIIIIVCLWFSVFQAYQLRPRCRRRAWWSWTPRNHHNANNDDKHNLMIIVTTIVVVVVVIIMITTNANHNK